MMEGNAREAIQFYEKAIGAKVLAMSTYGDMPEMPNTFTDELKNLVAHARLQVGESELMFSDAPGGSAISNREAVNHLHYNEQCGKSIQIYEALRQDGQVNMPFEETPFSPGFADVTDKFGVTFQIYTESQYE